MSTREIPKKLLFALYKKFNIIEHVMFMEFDQDYDILKNRLLAIKKTQYDAKDKIIVEHLDTDFYLPEMSVGVAMRNFFTVVGMVDIPLNTFIFYTNHFGIKQEIDLLCAHASDNDRPAILQSFVGRLHYPESGYNESDANFDSVQCAALSLIHGKRTHRHALYNHICHISKDKLAIKFTPQS